MMLSATFVNSGSYLAQRQQLLNLRGKEAPASKICSDNKMQHVHVDHVDGIGLEEPCSWP